MFLLPILAVGLMSQDSLTGQATQLQAKGLSELRAYSMLEELSGGIGQRIAGSPAAARAVTWGQATMERLGFQNVHLVNCMVPHWVRGLEDAEMLQPGGQEVKLTCCALGGTVGTPHEGITADVVEVHSLDECRGLGSRAKGKIIFFNGPFDPTLLNTMAQYGRAVGQRVQGPKVAAQVGAVGVVVRSMTSDPDDVPHTGMTDPTAGIPAVALSIVASNRLSGALKSGPVQIRLTLSCRTLPDEPSADVVGELTGTEHPEQVIVVGGHLDSWDKGRGAHDDGAGVVHSLEALRLLHDLGWKPKRTIRVVLFMDEEQSGRGADAYAAAAKSSTEQTIAALESDSGGFAPRLFSSSLSVGQVDKLASWLAPLSLFEIERIGSGGGGGADVGPLADQGAVLFGLEPESQRYFDYHHSDKDTIDKVNPRELELGAMSMAMLVWLISEQGLPAK